jgi:hypothetical protein
VAYVAYVVSISPILANMKIEAKRSPETRFIKEPHGITSKKTAFFEELLY